MDDTTTEVYGRHSTKYFLQEDVFENNPVPRELDTTINHLHYYTYQYGNNTWYQNLGNLGTAMKSIYYQVPKDIGYRLGYEAFHPYLTTPEKQRYFDTKSPHTELYYLQGGTGEQRLFILLTRNVNPYWNLGGSYNRFTSTKQFAVVAQRDFQTDHHQINLFSSFKTKKEKYKGLLSFNYMQHWAYESGGIKTQENLGGIIDSGLYLYRYADVRLFRANALAARNYYRTTHLHLYHHYNPLDSGNNKFQIFHEFDWKRENQYYRDNNMLVDSAFRSFYGGVYLKDSLTAFYKYDTEFVTNKIGVKGIIGNVFYSFYYRNRIYSILDTSQYSNTILKPKHWLQDRFAGGDISYKFNEDISFRLGGQGLLSFKSIAHRNDSNFKAHDDYVLAGSVRYKKFLLEVNQSRVSPTIMQSRLMYNLLNWSYHKDSLDAVLNRSAVLSYMHVNGNRYLKIGLAYQRIDNLIYFRKESGKIDSTKVRPVQHNDYIDYIQPSIGFRTNWRWLYFENELILTRIFKDSMVLHMPEWFVMPKIYYQNFLFKKITEVQAGVELFMRSDYYADAYAPEINQFYWQNQFVVKSFPITNVFVNFQISRARIFVRVSNLFGDPNFQTGYMETPYYAGMRRSFQFGVIWRAFD